MPVIIKGDHICEKCKQKFDWVYFELMKSKLETGLPIVETIPTTPKVHCAEAIENNMYRIYINCPHCGYENIFVYDKQ